MKSFISIPAWALAGFLATTLMAAEPVRHWKLDGPKASGFAVKGGVVKPGAGARGQSLVMDGAAVLEVKDSAKLGHGLAGFTLLAWVNPYALKAGQQMIAAKNVYSKNHREWGVMIDKDGRFRLYLRQSDWQTVAAATPPKPGHWHQVGVVVTPKRAELWLNGKREGVGELARPLPPPPRFALATQTL